MTIPKSYEALAADLASEKILSKTLQGQKESYMMLADGRKFDLDALQQRLTVSEQRAPVAHESECTSCDGSGEYTDAIGDWRGYCRCPSGVEAEWLKGLMP